MKLKILYLLLCTVLAMVAEAQTYHINQLFLTINSRPMGIDTKLHITDSTVSFSVLASDGITDSITVVEQVIRKKKDFYIQTRVNGGAMNYEIALSSDKQEAKNNIYVIVQTYAGNGGDRKVYYFKGKRID